MNIGGLDKSSIKTYTFIPPTATALSALEVFADKQVESLESVIQLSRSQGGSYVVNINTASLLETTKSKQLEVFNTQSKIKSFSATVVPSVVIAHIFSAVDTASRQVAINEENTKKISIYFFLFFFIAGSRCFLGSLPQNNQKRFNHLCTRLWKTGSWMERGSSPKHKVSKLG